MAEPHKQQRILILDYGSQYTQLIARRVREAHVYCEIKPWDLSAAEFAAFAPDGIILSGGPQSVYDADAWPLPEAVLAQDVPILGICYGMQLLSYHFGGTVRQAQQREYGAAEVYLHGEPGALFEGFFLEGKSPVWMSHSDQVTAPPAGFVTVASSGNAPVVAMEDPQCRIYGVQFHPEVSHTPHGQQLIENFVLRICGCQGTWTPGRIIEQACSRIQQLVGDEHVVLGLSGGVDSAVAAALVHRALGNQLNCVFVDNGLLRAGEGAQVMSTFRDNLGVKVQHVDASQRFLGALQGVVDPEEKRKIIGNVFVDVFEEAAQKLPQVCWLAQGTIYPDVIESAGAHTGKAKTIKSHHNVGGLPERMHLKLLEPLRDLFKDEVRALGEELGLPATLLYRHPFPGPGLAVRILGEVHSEYTEMLRRADAIYLEELWRSGHYQKISQAFAVFLPLKSVGVMGDGRTYEYVIALRAVETLDFMTARWYPLPYSDLEQISNRIINEVPGVNRVVYDISSKPPATIEWE